MAVLFIIPGALRALTGGRDEVTIDGAAGSLSHALSQLWTAYPALRDRVMTEAGDIRPHINVFVDGANARDIGGLAAPVGADAEVVLLPAVSGGCCGRPSAWARGSLPFRSHRRHASRRRRGPC